MTIKNPFDQDKSSHVSCHKKCTKNQAVPGKVRKYLHLWSGFQASALYFEVKYCKQHGERYKLFHPVNFVKTSKSNVELIYDSSGLLDFQILFIATTQKLWTQLRTVATSAMSGYLTVPGYLLCPTPLGMNVSHTISLPEGHSMITSFSRFRMRFSVDIFTLSDHYRHGIITNSPYSSRLYESHILIFNTSIEVKFIAVYHSIGFKLLFSFHTHDSLPQRLSGLIFNCSVPYYDRFKQHMECNLKRECHAGEDEGEHCPFSSKACRGNVAVANNKCYVLYESWNQFSWLDNRAFCHEKGGRMVMVRSKEEEHAILELLRSTTEPFGFNVGLMLSDAVPNLYRHIPMWIDYTAAYTTPYILHVQYYGMLGYYIYFNIYSISLRVKNVLSGRPGAYICEHDLPAESHSSAKPASTMVNTVQINNTLNRTSEESPQNSLSLLTVCPAGHRTHDFLKCDREADCLEKQYELTKCPITTSYKNTVHTKDGRGAQRSQVVTVAMFRCDLVRQTLPYTLVCNFLPDCIDSSDETFCRHAQCLDYEHRCDNGQCVDIRRRTNVKCDRVVDCYDGSDEAICAIDQSLGLTTITLSPPARIDHTHDYFPIATPLKTPHTCPPSHFSCPGNFGYCLPMYVRCNRYYDCPNHEDEADCENYLCPGHYRCRGSIVCLHVTHLCDGVVQCQDQDDEVLCDFSCPQNCHCQGLAFLCPQPFPADNFPHLRYLDAAHTAINFSLLQRNTYLVWLSLRYCRLRELSNSTFVNLQFLDLSHNMIQTLSVVFIETLENLKEIRLSQNPLESMTRGVMSRHPTGLQRLDMSVTHLTEFDCGVFSSFPDVVFLNLSYCDKVRVTRKGFQCFPFLRELDVRGTHIRQSELSLFMGLQVVELIFSDNYRHCCSGVLPKVSHSVSCLAPSTGYSSCSHLLRFNLHRVFTSILTTLSLLGSVCCLLGHHLHGRQHSSSRPLDICVLSLTSADLMMGIYLIIIVSGDVRFHGSFLWHERDWTLSVSCKTAHFVAFVSTEASCFTCLWIVIDRLTALRSPSNRLHDRSACMACLVSWLTALCLAIVPVLLPEASWEAGGHSSLCIPMAMIGDENHRYTASVLGVFNSLTAFIAAICFFVVHYEVRSHYLITTSSQISQDMVMARRVMTIVLTDVIYWTGIGVLTIISCLAPSAVVSDVMTLMFIVGVPLKPVISPFLYLNGLVRERRKLVEESRLVSLLERRLRWPAVRGQPSAPHVARRERQETRTQSNQMGRLDTGQSEPSVHDRQAQPQVVETLSSSQGRKTQSGVEPPFAPPSVQQTTSLFRKTSTSQSAAQSSDRASHQWPAGTRDEDVLRFLTRCFDSNTLQPDDVQTMLERFQNQRPH